MKMTANLIRAGWVIEHNGRQWTVLKINIITPGKGSPFIQVEMRDLNTGSKTNERWRTNDSVEKLNVEERDCQYTYREGDLLNFMFTDTFEQFAVPVEMMGEQVGFLQDSMPVTVDFIEGKPVGVNLPMHVTLKVAEADPALKGQTVTTSYKPARLENGMKIMVPPFVNAGEKIVVATADCTYVERAK
ncbi:MAG: elongation factor P [Alphaproteobacteria bacterium]|nr:elongation factor P [Alphaproteobacteria bacterium]